MKLWAKGYCLFPVTDKFGPTPMARSATTKDENPIFVVGGLGYTPYFVTTKYKKE